MFILSADKSKLSVLQRGVITSGSVNVIDVKFQFSPEWDDMKRVAVFRVGREEIGVDLNDKNCCKLPWECVSDNDIGKTVYAGVYGMVGTTVVLTSVWVSLGEIREGTRIGNVAMPHTPSVAEQILADAMAARDAAEAAAHRAEVAAGIAEDNGSGGTDNPGDDTDTPDDPGTGGTTGDDNIADDDVATDDEVNDALDDIFGV